MSEHLLKKLRSNILKINFYFLFIPATDATPLWKGRRDMRISLVTFFDPLRISERFLKSLLTDLDLL